MGGALSMAARRRISLSVLAALLMVLGYFTITALSELLAKPNLFQAPPNQQQLTELAKAATLEIWCDSGSDDEYVYGGSGWQLEVEDNPYLITNGHVIEECIDSGTIFVYDEDQQLHVAELLGYQYFRENDTQFDVAVLRGRGTSPTLKLAAEEPVTGQWVMISGWPSLYDVSYQSVASGAVTGVLWDRTIVSDAQSQKGMSGGPVINSRGEVIGIHYASTGDSRPRSLSQPLSRLCGVAVVCDLNKQPVFPLKFPEEPIRKYLPDMEETPEAQSNEEK